MQHHVWLLRLGVLVAISGAGCDREPRSTLRQPSRGSSSAFRADSGGSVAQSASVWDTSAGPVLIVHSDPPSPDSSAQIVFPQYSDSTLTDSVRLDPAPLRGILVDLFGRGGRVGQARVGNVSVIDWGESDCLEWPDASLRPVRSKTLLPWTVAFSAGGVQALPLDSLAALSRTDSAQLVAEITRLASGLPNDTALSFRGLPFAVREAFRVHVGSGTDAVVANLVRKLNQEANPLEQHVLLVAERDKTGRAGRYRVAYFERSSGTEETVETTDVLAAILMGIPRRPALVLLREGYESSAYGLLERASPDRWIVRWTSVHTGC